MQRVATPAVRGGQLRSRFWRAGGEAMVKACGVVMAMLPG